LLVFPICKINLGLKIISKREDGYHNLETIFYPVPIHDAVEVITNNGSGYQQTVTENITAEAAHKVSLSTSGLVVAGETQNNLCVKAYELLKKDFPSLPPIEMHLHKAIPMGAGLGGGSADGAFTLTLLNKKYQLRLTIPQLQTYALQLGSDCPFFISNQPCIAYGRGEILHPLPVDLSEYQLAIINPGIHINTGWAFSQLSLATAYKENELTTSILVEILQQPIGEWKHKLVNDFEVPVFKQHPILKEIKEKLYHLGALYASMTGSGSTLFGLFKKGEKMHVSMPETYTCRVVDLQ